MHYSQINKFSSEQWKEYKELRLLSLQNEPRAFGSTYEKENNFTEENWKERLTDKNTLILFYCENNILAGMVGARLIDDVANIVGMYVIPKARGKGISKKLMNHLIKELTFYSNIKIARLSVNIEQIPALSLYKKIGFEIIKKDKSKMGDGNIYDEYLMEYKIIKN
jgi:ribosomal protein S18 acetylase RimI-like enzyme